MIALDSPEIMNINIEKYQLKKYRSLNESVFKYRTPYIFDSAESYSLKHRDSLRFYFKW